jgi:hypothetical protein
MKTNVVIIVADKDVKHPKNLEMMTSTKSWERRQKVEMG